MTVLSSKEIIDRIFEKNPQKKLTISPLIDIERQIGAGSVDIRLGSRFITTKRSKLAILDSIEEDMIEHIAACQEKMFVKIGEKLTIHPRQFVLAGSLEYIRLPKDLIAYLIGRSSWGRIGLIIATATLIGPGFSGIATFELVNLGEAPIVLRPGTRIAQMVLHKCESSEQFPYGSPSRGKKYYISTEPEYSKIYEDYEWDILRDFE